MSLMVRDLGVGVLEDPDVWRLVPEGPLADPDLTGSAAFSSGVRSRYW
jgi:hypothetical protein